MRKLLMVKRKNRVFCIILSIVLFAAGVTFGIMAILGHTDAYSAAISCLCAAGVITVQQKKSQPE